MPKGKARTSDDSQDPRRMPRLMQPTAYAWVTLPCTLTACCCCNVRSAVCVSHMHLDDEPPVRCSSDFGMGLHEQRSTS